MDLKPFTWPLITEVYHRKKKKKERQERYQNNILFMYLSHCFLHFSKEINDSCQCMAKNHYNIVKYLASN